MSRAIKELGWTRKKVAGRKVERNRGKNTPLMALLTLGGIGASMILEGAANGAAFETYVEHILVASLHTGQMVIMKNLRVHKSARVRQLIEEAGVQFQKRAWKRREKVRRVQKEKPIASLYYRMSLLFTIEGGNGMPSMSQMLSYVLRPRASDR
jgi:hypothetical protein